MKPLVSIIIINYHQYSLLGQCLTSLIQKTKEIGYEIIIVDNETVEKELDSLIADFNNIKLIKNKINLGFAAANNQGAKLAKGKYLLILNNDTIFIENSIKAVYDFAESLSHNAIIGIRLLNEDRSMQESVYNYTTVWNTFTEYFFLYKLFPRSKYFNKFYQNYHKYDFPVETGVVKGAFLFIKRETFLELDGFDERFFFYGEELDLCYRFLRRNGKVYYLPFTSLIHLGGATADRDLRFKFKNHATAKIQFFQKHFTGIKFLSGIIIHYFGLLIRVIIYLIGGILGFNKNLIKKSYYFLRQLFIYPSNQFK